MFVELTSFCSVFILEYAKRKEIVFYVVGYLAINLLSLSTHNEVLPS